MFWSWNEQTKIKTASQGRGDLWAVWIELWVERVQSSMRSSFTRPAHLSQPHPWPSAVCRLPWRWSSNCSENPCRASGPLKMLFRICGSSLQYHRRAPRYLAPPHRSFSAPSSNPSAVSSNSSGLVSEPLSTLRRLRHIGPWSQRIKTGCWIVCLA